MTVSTDVCRVCRDEGRSCCAPVAVDDLWTLYLSTVRYSLGRMTYMPYECDRLFRRYGGRFSAAQRRQLAQEIEEALGRAAAHGHALGMQCDEDAWRRLVAALSPESVHS